MRVLQIIKTNEGATWAFRQAKWLFDNGIDIITVLPTLEGGIAEKYKAHGMKTIMEDCTLPVKHPWKLFERAKKVQRLVEKTKPDIIHCHFVTNIMMVRLALRRSTIPRLFQVPGPLHLENILFRNAELIVSQSNDFWAGSCKNTCDIYLNSGVNRNKIFLTYYGNCDGNVKDEYLMSQGILHKEYGISQDKILVGMVSYFYKPKVHLLQTSGLKGHEDFIDAIALVREKYPSVVGVVIGGAWGNAYKYVEKVKKYAVDKCKEGIIFTGFRSDIKDIYRELDIAVHPSHSENLGGAAESLAAGVPTISTNIGGFPDIVIDGVTGYTVKIKSPDSIATAIITMIENPEKAKVMSENGKQVVSKLLDIATTGKAILNVYNKILLEDNRL